LNAALKKKISIDKKNLPSNKEVSMNIIFQHFSNHEIEITETPKHYYLVLTRSPFLYCENTIEGLDLLTLEEQDVLSYFLLGSNNIFSLLESWIPYGWSLFFLKENKAPRNLTIIHLDDHADLMSPHISVDVKGNWKDMFTGECISFSDSESIKKAIESGAITLGSIVTLLVHYVENVTVLHLKQNDKTILRYIKKDTEIDKLISPSGQKRMSVTLTKINPYLGNENNCLYLKTSNINRIIKNIPNDTDIFLHIDMDFFNNRFNGSNDWEQRLNHNPDLEQQKMVIKSFCKAISRSNIVNRVIHVSIGVSPSFYPSEYWKDGVTYLLNELKKIELNILPQIEFKKR
jgi:hypothetical protein